MKANLNLNKICIQHRVFPRGIANPSIDQVIHAFEQRLSEHQKSPARECGPWSADYQEWKQTTDSLQSQLTELKNALKVGPDVLGGPSSVPTTSRTQAPLERTTTAPKTLKTQPPISPSQPANSPNFQHISPSFSQKFPKNFPPKTGRPATAVIPGAPPSAPNTPANQSTPERTTNQPTIPPLPRGCKDRGQGPLPSVPQIPTESSTLTLARLLQSAAARKSRPDDKFAILSESDREQLIDWLTHNTYETVLQLAAKPRSEGGLDFHTSRTALHNFYHKHDLNDRLQSAIDILQTAQSATPPGGPNPLEQTLELLVHAQSVRTASQPNMNDRNLHHFLRHITRLRELQLRDRSVTIRQKSLAFRMQTQGYDIVKQTMQKLPELNEIVANKNITPRQAFAKGFRKVFGDQTCDYIEEANQKYAQQNPNEPEYDPTPDQTCVEPKLTETEKFRLMCEFPDTPMPEIRAIAAERRKVGPAVPGGPLSANEATDKSHTLERTTIQPTILPLGQRLPTQIVSIEKSGSNDKDSPHENL